MTTDRNPRGPTGLDEGRPGLSGDAPLIVVKLGNHHIDGSFAGQVVMLVHSRPIVAPPGVLVVSARRRAAP
jgi:hypothetical protein